MKTFCLPFFIKSEATHFVMNLSNICLSWIKGNTRLFRTIDLLSILSKSKCSSWICNNYLWIYWFTFCLQTGYQWHSDECFLSFWIDKSTDPTHRLTLVHIPPDATTQWPCPERAPLGPTSGLTRRLRPQQRERPAAASDKLLCWHITHFYTITSHSPSCTRLDERVVRLTAIVR